MVAVFILMFDNACKYNEPDSLIYKVRHLFIYKEISLFKCLKSDMISSLLSCEIL